LRLIEEGALTGSSLRETIKTYF